jgi:hypothetical protein
MKKRIAYSMSLLLGLVIGWYIEHRRAEHEKTKIVSQMVQDTEDFERERAARAARAIQLIDSGDKQQAVQLLSTPIAYYYSLHADAGRKDDRSTKVLALIEQLARTNQVVAARIAESSNAARIKTP